MPSDLQFPMTTKQFLIHAEQLLQRGDIVLSRSPTFTSWLIRMATSSPFSHAALVFLPPQSENSWLLFQVICILRDKVLRSPMHLQLVVRSASLSLQRK